MTDVGEIGIEFPEEKPKVCQLCGSTKNVTVTCVDLVEPDRNDRLCQGCHRLLHDRLLTIRQVTGGDVDYSDLRNWQKGPPMPLRPLTPEEQAKLHRAIVSWSVEVDVEEQDEDLAIAMAADELVSQEYWPLPADVVWLEGKESL